jgi:hypothetical protein
MGIIKSKWRCDRCYDSYEHKYQAENCCPITVSEIWECPNCTQQYSEQIAAVECCGYASDAPTEPTAAELEAAGQLRIF